MKSLKERILAFDWFYNYSDDHSVWSFWNKEWKSIVSASKVDEESEKILKVAVEVVNESRGYPSNDDIIAAWEENGL